MHPQMRAKPTSGSQGLLFCWADADAYGGVTEELQVAGVRCHGCHKMVDNIVLFCFIPEGTEAHRD